MYLPYAEVILVGSEDTDFGCTLYEILNNTF
jgi:hypothetical protein